MHISSGAVVYKTEDGEPKVLLLYRSKTETYHLPKGTQEKGESLEDTARREIREETGCEIFLKKQLAAVNSFFDRQGIVIQKKTHYFVADYIGGDLSCDDNEHDDVFFMPISEAKILLHKSGGHYLGFENELEVLEMFEKYIEMSKNA